jgi:ribosomal protein S18 acetylase RimI-like enzyme
MTFTTYNYDVHRVQAAELEQFLSFRAEGLKDDEASFRVTPEDDIALGVESWRRRLESDHVIAIVTGEKWLGVGGFSRLAGSKLQHKGLIWGMYVAPAARGTGVANLIMESLLEYARRSVRQVQLTVMADNNRAKSFYARHGFHLHATEPAAIRQGNQYADEALMWRLV